MANESRTKVAIENHYCKIFLSATSSSTDCCKRPPQRVFVLALGANPIAVGSRESYRIVTGSLLVFAAHWQRDLMHEIAMCFGEVSVYRALSTATV
jgi:hypothetical protein